MIPLGICTASKAVSAVVLSHLIHTVFLSVFTALALAKSTLCRSTSSFQRSAEHCLASQPAWGYPRVSWDLRDLPSIPHLAGEVANYQTLIICYNNPDIKKKKLKESEGGKKEKKIKDNGFPGFSSYMETLSTACQIHITGPILSTLLPWHIYLERWWKYGGWRVFEPLRRKRKICLRPSKADNSVTAVEELLCQKRQEQCWTLSNLPLQLSNREECGRGRTGGQWGD